MPDERPKLDHKNASTGDPVQQEIGPPQGYIEANDRRTIRQAIMTQLLVDIANEIIESGFSLDGSLRQAYDQYKDQPPDKDKFRQLRALITDPEPEFNRVRDKLNVSRSFGSINLVVFRNAMAISAPPIDVEEVAKRVVIRAGLSGGYRKRKFAGCK